PSARTPSPLPGGRAGGMDWSRAPGPRVRRGGPARARPGGIAPGHRAPRSVPVKTSSEHRFIGREPFEAALRAGECAPSVYGTRPWTISDTGGRISLRADPDRRLAAADPGSRELVISCGAALYNERLALRGHGVRPRVALLPDPERPALLAEVVADGAAEPGVLERLRSGAVERRRTDRGSFLSDVGDVRLMPALRGVAAAEGAVRHLLTDDSAVRWLAGLVIAAEHLKRGVR